MADQLVGHCRERLEPVTASITMFYECFLVLQLQYVVYSTSSYLIVPDVLVYYSKDSSNMCYLVKYYSTPFISAQGKHLLF